MATESAPPARRNYWQLPTFALGVAAAVAAWITFPPPTVSSAERYGHDLAALKQALERKPVDAAALAALTPKVGEDADHYPESSAAAHYLAGSGYCVLAETNPEHWAAASKHLAAADAARLTNPADQQRLLYRRAKAEAATGTGDPAALVAALSRPPEGEDLDGERRRLLADALLRTNPPNLRRAKDEIDSYLNGPTKLPAPMLAAYRYKLGEIHVRLNEPEAARKFLAAVGAGAPGDVQAAAKVQLGRLAAAENNWAEAVRHYEDARSSSGLPTDQRRVVSFQIGVGLLHVKKPADAVSYLTEALAEPGAVGAAAAVRLAELTTRDPAFKGNRGKAVEYLETAVKDVPPGMGFRNPHVAATDVQAAFEEVIQVCLSEAEFPTAVRAAGSYAKVAPPGRDQEKRAEANAAWGAALQASAPTAPQAAEKFKAAAADYAALAKSHPTPTGKADFLRRAASCFRQGGDKPAAFAALDELSRTPGLTDESVAAVCVERGDLLLAEKQFNEAVDAFGKAMTYNAPSATVARTKLGVAHLEQAKLRPAEAAGLRELGHQLLTQVANGTGDSQTEKDARHQALFELGKSLFLQGNVADATLRFRQLIKDHPTGSMVGHAKLYLGSCLWAAAASGPGGQPPVDANAKLAEAFKLFEALSDSQDAYLRTQADIRLVNTAYLMRKYDEMPALCEKLTKRYPGTVEELIVQCLLFNTYTDAKRPELAKQVFTRMELVFAQLPKEKFAGGSEEYTREFWEKWFAEMKK
jgi:tetratricopeptide (TPR) repeat protein